MIIIKGYDTRYSIKKNAEVFAEFEDNEKPSAYKYLNKLKSGCMGINCKFWIEYTKEVKH